MHFLHLAALLLPLAFSSPAELRLIGVDSRIPNGNVALPAAVLSMQNSDSCTSYAQPVPCGQIGDKCPYDPGYVAPWVGSYIACIQGWKDAEGWWPYWLLDCYCHDETGRCDYVDCSSSTAAPL